MEAKQEEQLNILFLNLFDKQSLRRNAYFFKYLTEDLTLPIKVVYQQKKVAAITNNKELIKKALSNCPLIQSIQSKCIKLKIEGDLKMVKLFNFKDKKLVRRKLQEHSQKMKKQIINQGNQYEIDFQSHAAAIQFMQNLKKDPQIDFDYIIIPRNPYYSIKDCVINYKRQRNNHFSQISNQYDNYHSKYKDQSYKLNYQMQNFNLNGNMHSVSNSLPIKNYPIFIRKAVDTDSQQENQDSKKKQQEFRYPKHKYNNKNREKITKKAIQLKVEDFPSIMKENLEQVKDHQCQTTEIRFQK